MEAREVRVIIEEESRASLFFDKYDLAAIGGMYEDSGEKQT